MDSIPLNNGLQIVINSIVGYKLHSKERLEKEELYNLIEKYTNQDDNIDELLKNKIINKSNTYMDDIYNYLYDIEVSSNGDKL